MRTLAPVRIFRLFHHADNGAGKVVFAIQIHARHLGGFASDQRAAVRTAAAGNAGNHLSGDPCLQFAHSEIVEEKQRIGALHGDIVHAVVDQIFADRIMTSCSERDL